MDIVVSRSGSGIILLSSKLEDHVVFSLSPYFFIMYDNFMKSSSFSILLKMTHPKMYFESQQISYKSIFVFWVPVSLSLIFKVFFCWIPFFSLPLLIETDKSRWILFSNGPQMQIPLYLLALGYWGENRSFQAVTGLVE